MHRPGDRGRLQTCAGRVALGVRQVHRYVELGSSAARVSDQVRIDLFQHHFRTPEEAEPPLSIDRAPVQIKESVAARALDQRPAKVQRSLRNVDDPHVETPDGARCVTPEKLDRVASRSDADVDVLVGPRMVGCWIAGRSREVAAVELDHHRENYRTSLKRSRRLMPSKGGSRPAHYRLHSFGPKSYAAR